ncbi:MAG: methionyl-tRNA formyltransferase [Anaerolineae bacterium]|nr:methionyl-tRNA formyltransferase [Anaerolineae bacterium]
MMRTLFMGTPAFAMPPLQALLDAPDFDVVGVVTQPDRPAGRGQTLQQSPVKQLALTANVPVLQPEKLRAPGVFEQLAALAPDLIVVAAFGQILRQNVLDLPRLGCINVHASLLPRWRGAAPIQAAIRAGDAETGISIMKMDAGLDTGPVLAQRAVPIDREETGETLHDKLAATGGALLLETLRRYVGGEITPQPQDDSRATHAPMLTKEDGRIDWTQPARDIERLVRAYHPWPGAYTLFKGHILKILPDAGTGVPSVVPADAPPGVVVFRGPGLVGIGAGDGMYLPQRVQLAGRPALSISAFLNGHADLIGSVLGQ